MQRIHLWPIAHKVAAYPTGLGFLLCVAGALLAAPWCRALRQPATRDLSVFWRARVALQLTGALWLVWPRCSQAVPGSSTAACTPSGMSRAV